jgi:hypothetical protein
MIAPAQNALNPQNATPDGYVDNLLRKLPHIPTGATTTKGFLMKRKMLLSYAKGSINVADRGVNNLGR